MFAIVQMETFFEPFLSFDQIERMLSVRKSLVTQKLGLHRKEKNEVSFFLTSQYFSTKKEKYNTKLQFSINSLFIIYSKS